MAVKLELYRVFKEVAETGNISVAAKNLYISQSAVSQSIKQLETALQARLFARSPRGVTLTGEGQMLYQYVRSALGLIATGEDKLSQAQQLLLGTLVIGASDTVTSWFLTPYLDEFHRQHPGIRLKIVSGRSAKVLSLLKSGAVDIAFASSPADSAVDSWPCFPPTPSSWPGASTPAILTTPTPARRSRISPSSCWSERPAAGCFWSRSF